MDEDGAFPDGAELPAGYEQVYFSQSLKDGDGNVLDAMELGSLSPDAWARVAAPDVFHAEPTVYHQEVISIVNPDGTYTETFRVLASDNKGSGPPAKPVFPERIDIAPEVVELLATFGESEPVQIALRLRDVPRWNVRLQPRPGTMSVAAFEQQEALRNQELEARRELLEEMAAPLLDHVEQLGGELVELGWRTGWVHVSVPAGATGELFDRDDVLRVAIEWGTENVDAAPPAGSLGSVRAAHLVDADKYWAHGYTGERSNLVFSGASDILIGVVETYKLEDEACSLMDGSSCTSSRVLEGYECTNSGCTAVSDIDDCEELGACGGGHPTMVVSVAAADLSDHQARGLAYGDPAWTCTPGPPPPLDCTAVDHDADWELAGSGLSPEAAIVFASFEDAGTLLNAGRRQAYEQLTDRPNGKPVDILNMSHTVGSSCDISPKGGTIGPSEEALEQAFREGVFLVGAAGNNSGPSSSACNVGSPAYLPTVFAVNGYDLENTACQAGPISNCLIDEQWSARGGGSIDGITLKHSIIDALAPTRMTHYTEQDTTGGPGYISTGIGFATGTSAATPVVSGAAALVKDEALGFGFTQVNLSGVLHTLMLSMTERGYDPSLPGTPGLTSRRSYGSDKFYGLGRIKLRQRHEYPISRHFVRHSFTGLGSYSFGFNAYQAIPANTAMLKCVAFQNEYMYDAGKTGKQLHDVDLTVQIFPMSGSSCPTWQTPLMTRADAGRDSKEMVMIKSAEVGGLAGKCARVILARYTHVYYDPLIVNVQCTAEEVLDYDHMP